ncbi:hypothetical protein WJX84_012332 [Apatococcus fuscideae]|uniref:KH type-2 domain-containing protein n=1 Tax=Apatococcus fuscideae TaxID=2026836 RepID=A0AAW1SXQ8_9CHLO
MVVQVVREKVFQMMHQELPYAIKLQHTLTRILADNSVRLEYDVLVPHEGARGMLVGSNGRIIGMIGIAARRELEHLWRMRVHLFLQVSVKN